jgi:hypothetical protein
MHGSYIGCVMQSHTMTSVVAVSLSDLGQKDDQETSRTEEPITLLSSNLFTTTRLESID